MLVNSEAAPTLSAGHGTTRAIASGTRGDYFSHVW